MRVTAGRPRRRPHPEERPKGASRRMRFWTMSAPVRLPWSTPI